MTELLNVKILCGNSRSGDAIALQLAAARTRNVMDQRVFCTSDEVAERFGSRESLRELVEFHGLRFYVRLWFEAAEHVGLDTAIDNLRAPGRYEHARWRITHTIEADQVPGGVCQYSLDGWFKLSALDSVALAHGRTVKDPHVASFDERGSELGFFFGLKREVTPSEVRVRRADLDALMASLEERTQSPRLLDARERTTLLAIIGGLARVAGMDLAQPYKAAAQVEAALRAEGVAVSARAIGDHLKAVRNALDSRKD